MAVSNKAILDKITKANKYIKTLKEQGLQNSVHAKKLREAVNRSSKGSKPQQYFYSPKGKIGKQQRKQLLKVYEELKHVGKYIGGSTEPIKEHPFGTYTETDTANAIRENLSLRYGIDKKQLTDEFFDMLNSDAVQKLFEPSAFGSYLMEVLLNAIQEDNTILYDTDLLTQKITDYVNSEHKDNWAIEQFEDVFKHFRE